MFNVTSSLHEDVSKSPTLYIYNNNETGDYNEMHAPSAIFSFAG